MELRHTHRLYVTGALTQGSVIAATTEQAHHLLHVLRLKQGDVVRLFNGREGEVRATLEATGKRTVQLAVHEPLREQSAGADVWLCCAVIKKGPFDFMIEKATELGVSEIQPLLTDRTQVREVNTDRVYNLCREAAEQSSRLNVPAIGNPVSLADFIDVFPSDRRMLVCAEHGEAVALNEAMISMREGTQKIALVVGPEGGFSPSELDALRKAPNAVLARLGSGVLRAETAAIVALGCWQTMCGDWMSRPHELERQNL